MEIGMGRRRASWRQPDVKGAGDWCFHVGLKRDAFQERPYWEANVSTTGVLV